MNIRAYGLPYWLDIERPRFPQLDTNIRSDMAIVGAGIAGLKLAHCLARYGFRVTLLEGDRVGEQAASSRNQGSINHGAAIDYSACIRQFSRETARDLWQLGLENHRLLRTRIETYEIDCDYEVEGYTYLARRDMPGWESQLDRYQVDYDLLREDGFEVSDLDETEAIRVGGSPLFAGGLSYQTDAQFHSGKYLLGLAQGVARLNSVELFEQSRVQAIARTGNSVHLTTGHGVVSADRVFLATNALVPQIVPALENGLRAERGQVLVTEPLPERPCTGSYAASMAWWREIIEPDGQFRLLLGGGRKRDEPDSLFPQFGADGRSHPQLESAGFSPSTAHQQRLDREFVTLFPHLAGVKITHRWGGLQSFTADDLPLTGLFDSERRIHGLAGFCGRGNCYSDVGAEFLAGKAAGMKSEVEARFGSLIDTLMQVGRPSAAWGEWDSLYTDAIV